MSERRIPFQTAAPPWRAASAKAQPARYLPRADREAQLVALALDLAEAHGFERVTKELLAHAAGCAPSNVSRYWTASSLQSRIMDEAVETRRLRVVAQGLAVRHPAALAAPLRLRRAAALSIVGE